MVAQSSPDTVRTDPLSPLPGETPKALDALTRYAAMKPQERSLRALAAATGYNHSTVRAWSRRWSWTERLAMMDSRTTAAARSIGDRVADGREFLSKAMEKAVRELARIAFDDKIKATTRIPALRDIIQLGGITPPSRSKHDNNNTMDRLMDDAADEVRDLPLDELLRLRAMMSGKDSDDGKTE